MAATYKHTHKIGTRVRIREGAGLDSGKTGTIIKPELDHRGVPKVEGAYNPFRQVGRMAERMLLLDGGKKTTMFCALLEALAA